MRRCTRPALLLRQILAAWAIAATIGLPGFARCERSVDPGLRRIEQATCGQPGLVPCPLQRFMRENVAAPLARGETKTIAESLRKVATLGPSEFATWLAIATRGAAAADQSDMAALRAACNACHQAYRAEYRAKYRAHPILKDYGRPFLGEGASLSF